MCACVSICVLFVSVSLCMIVPVVCDERCKRVLDEGVWVKGALLILSKDSILIVQSLPVNGSKHLSRVKQKNEFQHHKNGSQRHKTLDESHI